MATMERWGCTAEDLYEKHTGVTTFIDRNWNNTVDIAELATQAKKFALAYDGTSVEA